MGLIELWLIHDIMYILDKGLDGYKSDRFLVSVERGNVQNRILVLKKCIC